MSVGILLSYYINKCTTCSNIRAVPVGASRGVKKIVKAKVPNLGRFDDVSEFLTKYFNLLSTIIWIIELDSIQLLMWMVIIQLGK